MPTKFEELKDYARSRGWTWKPGAAIPYGEQIIIGDAASEVVANFWPKRGALNLQGRDSALKAELRAWLDAQTESTTAIPAPHIGLDESGKGDWFGPLVVAAMYVDGERIEAALRKIGVRDSKLIESAAIQHLADQIERLTPPEHRHLQIVEPEALWATPDNMNVLLAEIYAQTAQTVWQATRATAIVCDQFSQRADRLERAFAESGLPRPRQQHHAEAASMAVAAASVLASAAFARALEAMGQAAGFGRPLPKGASDVQQLEAAARWIVKRHGREALKRFAKPFKPVQAFT
jgi:ribonuclease HIII